MLCQNLKRSARKTIWACIQARCGYCSASQTDIFNPNETVHWISPSVEAQLIAGRGRGLVAATPLQAGDLVLAVQPMAILHGPHEEMPDPSLLSPFLWQLLCSSPKSSGTAADHLSRSTVLDASQASSGWGRCNPLLAATWMPLLHRGQVQPQQQQQQPQTVRQQQQDGSQIQTSSPQQESEGSRSTGNLQRHAGLLHLIQALLHLNPAHLPASGGCVGPEQQHLPPDLEAVAQKLPALSETDMDHIVAHNAFGDEYEDLVAADLRQSAATQTALVQSAYTRAQKAQANETNAEQLREHGKDAAQSHVGLWPHFSLLNHSCLPTCVHYVAGSTMVVRAIRDVQAHEEITVSYLGREDFSPATARQRVLRERFGFTCHCPRCQLEAKLNPQTTELLQKINRDCKLNLGPAFLSAIEEENKEELAQVGSALVSWSQQLQPVLQEFLDQAYTTLQQAGEQPTVHRNDLSSLVTLVGGPEAAVLLVEATAYDYLELLQQHTQLCASMNAGEGGSSEGEERACASAVAALHLCGQVLHATSRGSELHVFVASRLYEVAQQQDACALDPIEAARGFVEALIARYGNVPEPQMEKLVRACLRRSRQFIM